MQDWGPIAATLEAVLGERVETHSVEQVTGGCINRAWRLHGRQTDIFVKTNSVGAADMFAAEADGLRELAAAAGLRVPDVYALGEDDAAAWLALEWIEPGTADKRTERMLGEGLAAVHSHYGDDFGWCRDNTIGSTVQRNDPGPDWSEFFAEHRLGFQLDLAERAGWPATLIDAGRRLQEGLGAFFAAYDAKPSLLHGDLWAGNWGADVQGLPFVFDPAVYYGDREADLAMTELFGGFGAEFRASYEAAWPTDPGFGVRRDLYNLYHVLNHLNLFGSGYLTRAEKMVERLLAALR